MVCDVHQEVSLGKFFQSEYMRHRHNNLFLRCSRVLNQIVLKRRLTLRAEGVIFPGKIIIPRFIAFSSKMLRSLIVSRGYVKPRIRWV